MKLTKWWYFVECDSIDSMKPSSGTFLCASTYFKEGTSCELQCQNGMIPGNKQKMTCKAERTAELNVISYYWTETKSSFECVSTIRYNIT